ncbi:MAG: outer membrane protein assembly factor BamE [Luteimonas sp.]
MRKLIVPALAALLVAGCGITYRQPIYQGSLLDESSVEQLQAGMSRQQVLGLLGTPSVADPFHHDRWDYTASQRTGRRGNVEIKNLTLWFENNTLARWDGEYFPDRDAELVNDVRRAFGPNLPRERNRR